MVDYSLQMYGKWKLTGVTVLLSIILASGLTAVILILFNRESNIAFGIFNATICVIIIATPFSYAFFMIMDRLNTSQNELRVKNSELASALKQVKELSGLLPICSNCKKIRDNNGCWNQLETYIESHSDALFSHGLCEECAEEMYGGNDWYKNRLKFMKT